MWQMLSGVVLSVSMRIVPNQDAAQIEQKFCTYVNSEFAALHSVLCTFVERGGMKCPVTVVQSTGSPLHWFRTVVAR